MTGQSSSNSESDDSKRHASNPPQANGSGQPEDSPPFLSHEAFEVLSSDGDITAAFHRMRRGDQEACAKVWDYFKSELLRKAGLRLSPVIRKRVDPEDIVNTAFRTFARRAAEGEFSEIDHRDDILGELSAIVFRRAMKRIKREQAAKRDLRKEAAGSGAQDALDGNARPVSLNQHPTVGPDEDADLEDLRTQLVDALPEKGGLRAIGKAWLANNFSTQAVKETLGLAVDLRSVQRKIKTICEEIWQPMLTRMGRDLPIR